MLKKTHLDKRNIPVLLLRISLFYLRTLCYKGIGGGSVNG